METENKESPTERVESACPPTLCSPFNPPAGSFQWELNRLINAHSIEGGSNTPDFILAEYLRQCLEAFDMATRCRDEWHKRALTFDARPSEAEK